MGIISVKLILLNNSFSFYIQIRYNIKRRKKKTGGKMESLREFYKIGNGPSSSHTMGPEKAAKEFRKIIENEYDGNNIKYKLELYGSLAAKVKVNLTD